MHNIKASAFSDNTTNLYHDARFVRMLIVCD